MPGHLGGNLLRLMADRGLSIRQVTQAAELDERTVRGILDGTTKPHAQSLHRLAEGLGVEVDEFFLDSPQLLYRRSDRPTNPIVQQVMQTDGPMFADWGEADFDRLHRRIEADGDPTREDVIEAVRQMNRRRAMHEKLDRLLESPQAEIAAGMIELLDSQIAPDRS